VFLTYANLCSLFTLHAVLFVTAFSTFHSIRFPTRYTLVPRFPPLYGAAFSSLAFSTAAFLAVPRFPFSHFQSPRTVRLLDESDSRREGVSLEAMAVIGEDYATSYNSKMVQDRAMAYLQ